MNYHGLIIQVSQALNCLEDSTMRNRRHTRRRRGCPRIANNTTHSQPGRLYLIIYVLPSRQLGGIGIISPMKYAGDAPTPSPRRAPSSAQSRWQNRWYYDYYACRQRLRESVPLSLHRSWPQLRRKAYKVARA